MEPIACVVFAKPPVPGQVKTRLAATIGADAAASLARAFLRDTVDRLRTEDGLHVVVSTTDPTADHGVDVPCWDQGPGELGARLERGFRRALRDFRAAIALGADAPGLPVEHLRAMRTALADGPVLGPTDDGGFWGLGLHTFPEGLLLGLPWSTSETARATADRLRSRGMAPTLAPGWWDIDVPADLERFRREVARTAAPATHAVLDTLGWR